MNPPNSPRFRTWIVVGLLAALVFDPIAISVAAEDRDGRNGERRVQLSADDDRNGRDGDRSGRDGTADDAGDRDRNGERRGKAKQGRDKGRGGDRGRGSNRDDDRGRGRGRDSRQRDVFPQDDDDAICIIEDPDGNPATDGYCADQVMVRLQPGADVDKLKEKGVDPIVQIAGQPVYLLKISSQPSDEAAVARELERDQSLRVVWAERNFTEQAPEGRPRRFFPSGGDVPRAGSPDQAYAPRLIGADSAAQCVRGAGTTVAVIDSGIDAAHPAFAGVSMRGAWDAFPVDGLDEARDVGDEKDNDNDGLMDEMTGHGTHVAGIVAQVAPGATIMPIRALDSDGIGQAFYLSRAIYRAVDQNAKVVNLSLGSTEDTRIVREAIAHAIDRGRFVVAAAGNNGPSGLREYPATQDGVFGIAATDAQDRPAEFSNRHPAVDLSAPGAGIVSAFARNQPPKSPPLGSDYALWSGTSMATPWVAGAAALLFERNPGWTAAQVADRLRSTADPIAGSPAGMGSGRLDVGAAVDCGGFGGTPIAGGGGQAGPGGDGNGEGNNKGKDKGRGKGKGDGKKGGKKGGKSNADGKRNTKTNGNRGRNQS